MRCRARSSALMTSGPALPPDTGNKGWRGQWGGISPHPCHYMGGEGWGQISHINVLRAAHSILSTRSVLCYPDAVQSRLSQVLQLVKGKVSSPTCCRSQRKGGGILPLPTPPHGRQGEQDLFSIFTPSGPAHPRPHEQGQLYGVAQVRREDPLYQMMQLVRGRTSSS